MKVGELKYNSMRKLSINADTTFRYIQVFNGILELTQKEMTILSEFIDVGDVNNLCTIKSKKAVAERVGIKDFNTLNNYIKRLKDKGAIVKLNNFYTVVPFLLPGEETLIQIKPSV